MKEQRTHHRRTGVRLPCGTHAHLRVRDACVCICILARVPPSSSIIRRHGRVRFAVSTGDRVVLSHFLPANRAPPPPLASSAPALSAPSSFRLRRLPVGGLGSPCFRQNDVVMETSLAGYTLRHTLDNMADPTLRFSACAPSTRASTTISLAGEFRRRTGRRGREREGKRERARREGQRTRYGGKPHEALGAYRERTLDPPECHSSYPHGEYGTRDACRCVRGRAPRFSIRDPLCDRRPGCCIRTR